MTQVRFIDYIRRRVKTSGYEKSEPFVYFLKDLKGFLRKMDEENITDGQEVLVRLLHKYRKDQIGRVQVGLLVNAYRSYCKYKDSEEISIRRATRVPYL